MYRGLSKPPKGPWARHLQEQRRRRDLSQQEAFELVYERIGWSAKSRTAYTAIDNGNRQPKDNEVIVLGAEFGWPPDPEVVEEAASDQAALIAKISELVGLLRPVVEQAVDREARLRAVEAELQSLRERSRGGGSRGRSVRRATAG